MKSSILKEQFERLIFRGLIPLVVLLLCLSDSARANPGLEAAYEAAAYSQIEFKPSFGVEAGALYSALDNITPLAVA